jgi:transcriptional regulator with XRE-family HTH domain
MAKKSAGRYLWSLRERCRINGRKVSRSKLAALTDLTESTIWKIEHGMQRPNSDNLQRIIEIIGGSMDEFGRLLVSPGDDPKEGQQSAEEWLTRAELAAPNDADAVLAAVDLLRDEPKKMAKLRGYAEALAILDVT